jgi:hypothetical protein
LPNDSSGRLTYVQVRYPGFELSTGNELNGITVGGVGRGTVLENIQVHNSSDDGIEWFGGTVNGRYLVLTGNDDDSIDTDLGYSGSNQFVIVTQRSGGGDAVWEADSNGNEDATPRQDTRFANVTAIANGGNAILLRGGGDYQLLNWVLTTSVAGSTCLDIDGNATVQAANPALDENGPPVFKSNFFGCAAPYADDTSVTAAQIQALFEVPADNNAPTGTSTLTSVFINGANETARTPFNASTANPSGNAFLVNTTYIGAVRDAADTWWQGWTCGLPGQPACTANPAS